MPPLLNSNWVVPVGMLAPGRYFDTKPKLALPAFCDVHTLLAASQAPIGDVIHPPPVTKLPLGSNTTT